jgi:hypothetical protein
MHGSMNIISFINVDASTVTEPIEVRECLLSFGAEFVVFQVAIQKLKDQDI